VYWKQIETWPYIEWVNIVVHTVQHDSDVETWRKDMLLLQHFPQVQKLLFAYL
jgi:hypothetical protein